MRGEIILRVLELQGDQIVERKLEEIEFDNLDWIDLSEPTDAELKHVAEHAGITIRDLRESLDPNERPRIDEIDHYTAIVFTAPFKKDKELATSAAGFFLSDKLLVTVHQQRSEAIERLMESREKLVSIFQKGATRLLVKILEEDTQEYFKILDAIEEDIEEIEGRVFGDPQEEIPREIFRTKKTLIFFHKALTANLDVANKLEKDPDERFDQQYLGGVRYVQDDMLQMIDMVATYRDLLRGALDIYLSSVSNHMNAIIKRMTAWASIILIPTFITGLYGMNFDFMPELNWQYGYAFAWALIIASVIALITFFKKKDWF